METKALLAFPSHPPCKSCFWNEIKTTYGSQVLGFVTGLVAQPSGTPGLWVREGWSCSSSSSPHAGTGIPTQRGRTRRGRTQQDRHSRAGHSRAGHRRTGHGRAGHGWTGQSGAGHGHSRAGHSRTGHSRTDTAGHAGVVSAPPCTRAQPKGQGGVQAGQPGWNSVMEGLWNSLAVPQARQDCNKHLL